MSPDDAWINFHIKGIVMIILTEKGCSIGEDIYNNSFISVENNRSLLD